MTKASLTIATRESPLAMWQANWVKKELERYQPNLTIHLLGLTTTADKFLEAPLTHIGGKGLFVKELEEALLDGRADLAVHSMKDVPMELPEGLILPVMCQRDDPRDAFVSNHFATITDLPLGATLGSSSLRRRSCIAAKRPDLDLRYLRGNVNTRLKRLDQGEFAGIILAAAGLKRLNFTQRIRSYLDTQTSLPAAGQGVLGIECRANDNLTQQLIAPLHHKESYLCVSAERAMCRELEAGCQVPVAAFAELVDNRLFLRGRVSNLDGTILLHAEHTDNIENADALGKSVANDLIAQGALALLASLKDVS